MVQQTRLNVLNTDRIEHSLTGGSIKFLESLQLLQMSEECTYRGSGSSCARLMRQLSRLSEVVNRIAKKLFKIIKVDTPFFDLYLYLRELRYHAKAKSLGTFSQHGEDRFVLEYSQGLF